MPTLTIDGKEIAVDQGTTILQAALELGIQIPHFCFHPGLSISGNCRMCLVEVEGMWKPQISCATVASDGMVVFTDNEKVRRARKGVLELILKNHPIDCPVCDQAGECSLQDYYLEYGLYTSRLTDEKVRKPKVVNLGERIVLDAERCVLCSRCVRFCEEVTKTHELGLFNRGDHTQIGTFPGMKLVSNYQGNLADVCPVGALTSKDFRFKCRVWYLKGVDSICPGCARGCNIRLEYANGEVQRLLPRFNPDVNGFWLCDQGRFGFHFVNGEDRIPAPKICKGAGLTECDWDEAVVEAAKAIKNIVKVHGGSAVGVIASPDCCNEDLWLLRRFAHDVVGTDNLDFRMPGDRPGIEDDFLMRGDRHPNARGAADMGVAPRGKGLDTQGMLREAAAGNIKALYIVGWDPVGILGDEAKAALEKADLVIVEASKENGTLEYANILLAASTFAERGGTFTNFEGRVQRIHGAMPSKGRSLAHWEIVQRLAREMDQSWSYSSAEEIFDRITREVDGYKDPL